jgi:hypothetical protein
MSFGPSLASTTSTRVDSSSKHIQACKVHDSMIMRIGDIESQDELHNNKMNYCMHKDEIVLCVSRPLYPTVNTVSTQRWSYPPVLTTLGNIRPNVKMFVFYLYHRCTNYAAIQETYNLVRVTTWPDRDKNAVNSLPFFVPVGISLGQAFASPRSGDTVASVMIGGLRTIRNGAFNVYCGDILQWYWDGEEILFDRSTGERQENGRDDFEQFKAMFQDDLGLDTGALERKRKYDQSNGNWGAGKAPGKNNLAYVKPYVEPIDPTRLRFFDKQRVFCKAISDARPYDMVDIMISRQSL